MHENKDRVLCRELMRPIPWMEPSAAATSLYGSQIVSHFPFPRWRFRSVGTMAIQHTQSRVSLSSRAVKELCSASLHHLNYTKPINGRTREVPRACGFASLEKEARAIPTEWSGGLRAVISHILASHGLTRRRPTLAAA
jgi:hypothetical protein